MQYVNSELSQIALIVSAATKSPCLLIGDPGCGKSQISRDFQEHHWLDTQNIGCSDALPEDRVLGGVILEKALRGITERNFEVAALSSEAILFDEFFKIKDPTIRDAMLSALEPHPWIDNASQKVRLNYESMILTTNWDDLDLISGQTQGGLGKNPFWDRIILKTPVFSLELGESLEYVKSCLGLGASSEFPEKDYACGESIEDFRKAAMKIQVSPDIFDKQDILECCNNFKIEMSTRKIKSVVVPKSADIPSIVQALQYAIKPDSKYIEKQTLLYALLLSSWTERETAETVGHSFLQYLRSRDKEQEEFNKQVQMLIKKINQCNKEKKVVPPVDYANIDKHFSDEKFLKLPLQLRTEFMALLRA